jgi:hypothetical protein
MHRHGANGTCHCRCRGHGMRSRCELAAEVVGYVKHERLLIIIEANGIVQHLCKTHNFTACKTRSKFVIREAALLACLFLLAKLNNTKSNAYLFLKRLSQRQTSECYCLSAEVSTVMYCALHLCINRYFYVDRSSSVMGIVLRYRTNTSSRRERQESNYSGQLPFHTPFELYKNKDEVTSIHESDISTKKLCKTPGMFTTRTYHT